MRLSLRGAGESGIPAGDVACPLHEVPEAALAALMLDAYRGTLDDEGETIEEALEEIRATLAGQYGPVIAEASGAVSEDGELASALIATLLKGAPFVAYVFTRPVSQGRGHATALLHRAAAAARTLGHPHIDLTVTVGSQGERLYERLGYRDAAQTM